MKKLNAILITEDWRLSCRSHWGHRGIMFAVRLGEGPNGLEILWVYLKCSVLSCAVCVQSYGCWETLVGWSHLWLCFLDLENEHVSLINICKCTNFCFGHWQNVNSLRGDSFHSYFQQSSAPGAVHCGSYFCGQPHGVKLLKRDFLEYKLKDVSWIKVLSCPFFSASLWLWNPDPVTWLL